MTTRNLTSKYEAFRNQLRSKRSILRQDQDDGRFPLLDEGSGSGAAMEHTLPPLWVDVLHNIQQDQIKIKESLRTLERLHGERLKVSFGDDEVEKERDIDILTREVTRLIKRCEANIKRIAFSGDSGASLSQQEKAIRLNVMRGHAAELNALSRQFRQAQKRFLHQRKDQEQLGSGLVDEIGLLSEHKGPISLEEALERGMSEEQQQQLAEIEAQAGEREKEIIHIAQSINELSSMFKELSVLVIEQGSILDRIDYNIEQSLDKVKTAKKDLVKANEYSKKMLAVKCIAVLIFIILVLILILVIKHSR